MVDIDVSSDVKRVEIGFLLDLYGNILTEKQKLSMDLYFQQDFSLSEIAEQLGITRQAVRDSLLRAETTLYDTEAKLGLMKRFDNIRKLMIETYENASYVRNYAQRKFLAADVIDKLTFIQNAAAKIINEDNDN